MLGMEEYRLNNRDFSECVWINVTIQNPKHKLLMGCIYRSPSSTKDNNKHLEELINDVASANHDHLLIVGDFNYPGIDWDNNISSDSESSDSHSFIDTVMDNFLIQHVDRETRFKDNQKPSRLDLVLTMKDNVTDIQYLAPVGCSDHCTLLFDYMCKVQYSQSNSTKYRYDKGDFEAMRNFLANIHWEEQLHDLNVQEAWDSFALVLDESMNKFIPIHKSKGKKLKHQDYLDKQAFKLIKSKNRAWERFQKSQCPIDYKLYCDTRNTLRTYTRELRKKHEEAIANEIKDNPKAFWRYVKSKTSVRSGVGDLKDDTGQLHTDDGTKADILNNFFCSVFTREDDVDVPELETKHTKEKLMDLEVDEETIIKLLRKLKPGKSAGPDAFHPRVLQETAAVLASPLCMIFRKSINEGRLPHQWKLGEITPIFKKGDRSTPGNYRPVSLTSVLCKVMETIVKEKIMNHMESNKLFCDEQHGFVPGRSCMTQLLTCIDNWTEIIDDGEPLDAVYLDFRKAFDTVPHKRLVNKLMSYGIDGKIKDWILNFLSGRRQRVTVNGHTSQWAEVTSGIPQGSVLGPVLFVIYINDLPDELTNTVKIFADDTKLYGPVSTPTDIESMQEDLRKLSDWSEKWLLKFNASKCSVMHLGTGNPGHKYLMKDGKDVVLKDTELEKDLGLFVDRKLTFHHHVNNSVSKANRTLGVIKRTFCGRSQDVIRRLYTTLVRPVLEYGNAPRIHSYDGDTDKIEKVQRRATKLCQGLTELPYNERLKALNLPSMYHRRIRGDMIQVYKIMTGRDRVDSNKLLPLNTGTTRKVNSMKLNKKFSRLNSRKNSFAPRVTNSWNSLPESVVSAKTVNEFKTNIDKHWKHKKFCLRPSCTS